MNFYTIHNTNRQNCKKLILFFAGWGMDEQPFLNLAEAEYDIIIISNYSNLNIQTTIIDSLLNEYNEINIVAWSMGVWVAGHVLNSYLSSSAKTGNIKLNSKLNLCIAINGTPMPISDEYGIPTAIFNGTIDTLPQSIEKFNLRMCGSKTVYSQFKSVEPKRTAEDKKEELIALKESFTICNTLKWTKAVVAKNDRIFPPENQLRYWREYLKKEYPQAEKPTPFAIDEIDAPHYVFYSDGFKLSQLFAGCC